MAAPVVVTVAFNGLSLIGQQPYILRSLKVSSLIL